MSRKLFLTLALSILVLPGFILSNGCSKPETRVGPAAAIVDQLFTLDPNPVFIEKTTAALEQDGFKVDCYQGDNITVDFYRKLPEMGYKVIIFRSHAGLLGSGGNVIQKTCLFTNELYSQTAHVSEQLTDQLAQARVDADHPWVFGIGADFVNHSMQGRFDHTALIMMGCSTLRVDDLANSFVNKGASVYLGWNASVSANYVDNTTLVLLNKIVSNKMTLEAAVAGTMKEQGVDPDFGASLSCFPPANGKNTLPEALNPPVQKP